MLANGKPLRPTKHDCENMNRLAMAIGGFANKVTKLQEYRELVLSERSKRPVTVVDRHCSWVNHEITMIEKRIAPLQVEYDRIEALMAEALKQCFAPPTSELATTKTVIDLDRKGPGKNPHRKYVAKSEQPKPAASKPAKKNEKRGRKAA